MKRFMCLSEEAVLLCTAILEKVVLLSNLRLLLSQFHTDWPLCSKKFLSSMCVST